MARVSKSEAERPPPLYEVRELTLEEALLVLAAEKEERRIRAEEKAARRGEHPEADAQGRV